MAFDPTQPFAAKPDYSEEFTEAGEAHGVDPLLLRAVADVESNGDRFAVSHAGAEGLMQIMPGTQRELGVTDPYDPRQSIHGGAKYLSEQHRRFGNPYSAIAAYNAGPGGNFDAQGVQDYVTNVTDRWRAYQANPPPQPKPKSGFDPNQPFTVAPPKGGGGFDPNQPFTVAPGGRGLTSKQAVKQLPVAPTEAEAPLPPIAHPGEPAPDTGWTEALTGGLSQAVRGPQQTYQAVTGGRPVVSQPTIAAAEPIKWADVLNPGLLGRKFVYGMAASAPEMVGFGVGAALAGGPETPVGMVAGAAGAALTHAATSLGPAFGVELQATPNDPDGAFNRAMQKTGVSSLFTGAMFGSFGIAPFQGALKNLMFQAFGLQPGLAVAEKATSNVMDGKPASEDLTEGVPGAVLMTAAPMAAHAGARWLKGRGAQPPEASPELQGAAADMTQAATPPPPPGATPPPPPPPPGPPVPPIVDLQAQAAGKPPSGTALPTLTAMAAEAEARPPTDIVTPKGGTQPLEAMSPVPPTTPEPPTDLHAQIAALADPNNPKDAVFIAAGTDWRPFSTSGAAMYWRPEGTLFTNNPAKARAYMDGPLDDAKLAQILGYPETKDQALAGSVPQGQAPVIVQGTDAAGNVVHESVASPAGVPAAQAAAESVATPAGGGVRVTDPVTAQVRRKEPVTGETPPVPAPKPAEPSINVPAPEPPRPPGQKPALREIEQPPTVGAGRLEDRIAASEAAGRISHADADYLREQFKDQIERERREQPPSAPEISETPSVSPAEPSQPSINVPAPEPPTEAAPPPAGERPMDSRGRPIFQKGDRVVTADGHHGTIAEAQVYRMQPIFGGGPSEPNYSYVVKTDRGRVVHPQEAMAPETGEAPHVVPDPVHAGHATDPETLQRNIDYDRRAAEQKRGAAARAVKRENKQGHINAAVAHEKSAAEKRAVLDAWKAQYPEEAARIFPPKPGAPAAPTPSTLSTPSAAGTGQLALIETKHGKTGEKLFTVTMGERVERDRFTALRDAAAQHGGKYSSYKGHGAVPGFEFRSREAAEQFLRDVRGEPPPELSVAGTTKDQIKALEGAKPTPEVSPPAAAPEARPADYGANNTIFTADAAAKARERLRAKLGRLSTGLDPEMMMDGLTLAGYHIEAGARSFADYASAMVNDLGEAARPYLRSWYESVRHFPGHDTTGMSNDAEIARHLQREAEAPISDPRPGEGHGLQEPVPESDAGQGAGDVGGTHPSEPTDGAPAGEEPGGPRTPGATPGERTEDAERPPMEHLGTAPGGGGGPRDTDRVPGEAGPEPGGATGRSPTNHVIAPGTVEETRSFRVKAADNLAAIELAKRIIAEDRPATPEEQAVLAKYVGWGGIPQAFEGKAGYGRGFETIGARLKEVLSPEEYATASRSTQYAHYTAENVVRAMWDAAEAMGFRGGSVFEPGMGIGHFLGMMPPDLAAKSRYDGIEFDHLTAQIAKLLYPESGIREADYFKTPMPEGHFDLAIGNPPFSDVVIREDPKYAPRRFMMHDYFFAKTLDSVRPGGLLGFVTSAGTMNKMDSAARNYLAERAEFVGGVRLPSSAFRRNAGTEVTTDILFFRKRDQRIPLADLGEAAKPWTDTVIRDLPNTKTGAMDKVSVNRYFSEHPEQVLGQEVNGEQYAGGRYEVVQHPDTDLTTDLRAALDRLPKDVMTEPPTPEQRAELDFASGQKKDGSYYIGPDGALMQYRGGAGRQVARRGASEEAGITAIDMQRIHHLIPLRDALRDVFRADLTRDDAASAAGREALNKHYDAFTKKFGPINKAEFQRRRPTIIQQETARLTAREEARAAGEYFDDGDFDPSPYLARGAKITEIAQARQQARARAQAMGRKFNEGEFDIADIPDTVIEKRPNVRPFMEDPESYRMRSIEHYDDETGTAIKKPIFFKNILTHEREPEINSANDGVLWSMNKLGRFDLQAIAAKMGRSPDAIISELGDAVFKVPDTRDTWQTHDEYLSGDVVSKLAAAQKAAETDPSVRRNIPALEAAQPVPLAPSEIAMTIGMPWMPHALLEQFANEHMKIGQLGIQHSPALGAWVLDKRREDRGNTSGMAEWQAGGLPASKLLEMAMNRVPPKIYATDPADRNKRIFDAVATQAAQDKIDTIKQAFNDWLAQDPARHNGMARIYNDALNRVVLRKYDGTYLSTPGVASDWTWRPHQTQVISRIILDGNTYMAHAVGAGKTSAMIGSAMEMRRLGLIKKPMFVVPNHMLQQFTKEFYEQYPTARIAVADEQRFHTDRRRQFISNVSQDDLDAVIITHSSFGMIPISDAFQDHLIHEQIEMVREALSGLDKKEDRFTVKRLENQLEALQQKLSKKKEGRDLTNTFEELGVDFLYVDEAQEFRKLQYATRQSGMKGIDPDGSDMAWDLYSKARYLDSQRPGRSLVLASGTPVTNTMGELYTVSRYLQPRELNARGIGHFDSWAQMFGDTKTTLEQGPAGDYQPQTRFSRFVNMPELYKMVGSVMDIVTPTELSQYVTRPALEGGKRQFHMAPKTPFLEHYQRELAGRIEAIKRRRGPPEKGDDILLSVINDGRHSAIDPRFVEDQPNDPSSKLNMMLDNVVKIYHETGDTRFYSPGDNYQTEVARGPAAQMVFANLGVNGRGPVGFSSYAWMKSALVKAGIPRNEIAFIGDYKTHLAKQALFNDMNAGRIRVLIGSTKKMGTGINAQKRLIALHNLDPLWFPADDEQRVGRILRQGNMNPRIQVHDYATKGTYDSTMWNMMGRKGRFIEQFFRGDPTLRDMEDLGEASMYEQAAAMSTSDERMIKLTEMRQDRDRMVRRGDAHDREQYGLVNELDGAKRAVFSHGTSIASLHNDIAQRVDLSGDKFRMTVGNADYRSRKGAASALDETIKAVFPTIEDKPVKIAEISGFPIWLDKETNFKGEPTGRTTITFGRTGKNRWSSIEAWTGDGIIRSVETQLRGLESDLAYYQRRLGVETQRVAQIEPLIGKQFEERPEIERLSKAIRELEAELKTGKKAEPEKKAATGPRPEEVSGWLAGTEGGAQYSRRESEAPKVPLYSAVARAADALKQAKGTGAQILAMLQKTPGVKPEELKWLGLDDWLKGQGHVTKAAVQEYIAANALDVREVTKGGEAETGPGGWGSVGGGDATKFASYQLPGGENYREMLITLPPKDTKPWQVFGADGIALSSHDTEVAAWQAANRLGPEFDYGLADAADNPERFRSSHWDEPNVLAHVRFSDRTGPDGKRTLLVEEVQSDWHQKGRKQGYRTGEAPTGAGTGWAEGRFDSWAERQGIGPEERQIAWRNRETDPRVQQFLRESEAAINARDAWNNSVPDAPFKTTWPALTMKRMVKYAVDNGYDRIAWTPGEQQAARYDLSKQVDKVTYAPDTKHLRAWKGDSVVIRQVVEPDKLPDLIGKEAADKLLKQPLRMERAYHSSRQENVHSLSGLALKVGGEGMRGFYDRMLPNEVGKIVGKYGAKVGRSDLDLPGHVKENEHGSGWLAFTHDNQHLGRFQTEEAGRAAIPGQTVHSVDITPELRDAVGTEGLPLFAKRTGEAEPGKIDDAARAKLQDAGERMMRAAGLPPSIALKLVDRITDAAGKPVSADAKYTRSLISLALDTPHDQIASKLFHEVIHGVTDSAFGLLKPGEIAVLEHAADRWLDKGTNRADLTGRGYSPADMRAEAIARMGEDALARGLKPPEPYSKIVRFIERLGNWLRGQGFRTADDVFNSIMRGEKAAGSGRAAGASPERYAMQPGATPPPTPPGPLRTTIDRIKEATTDLTRSIQNGIAPMRTGTVRAQAYAASFANALRQVQYRYGQIDREILHNFTPAERDAMGRAMDAQSVHEQVIRDMDPAAQAAARASFDATGQGLAGLKPLQRQTLEQLDAISMEVWRRMQDRGMVAPKARGLPFYFPRQIIMWSEESGYTRAGSGQGGNKGIDARGANLTTQGPMRRKHLTPQETEAAAKAKLGDGATLLRDIRSLPSRLAYAERAIAGVDLMAEIEQVGKQLGTDLVIRGDIPGLLHPGDYFTMSDHPSFRQFVGAGWKAIHVAKEFEGPLRAILTEKAPTWYRGFMGVKSGTMNMIMFSPFIHLAVELGRSLPVMPLRVLTLQALRDGSRLRRSLSYMDQATTDGLAPLGQRGGWRTDPISIADEANTAGRNRYIRALGNLRDAVARGAGHIGGETLHDIVQSPHQTLLWDQVFNLQVGIYDTMRSRYIAKGDTPEVAGTKAAHIANRYAGALPPEHLSRSANMIANIALFSRSFTLGNLGVIKDMFTGAPSHIISRIEQMAGPEAAKTARSQLRRKAMAAVALDIGLFYVANGLLQAGLAQLRGEPELDDWLEESALAVKQAKDNPLAIFGVLPQHYNEPGKQDRVYAGVDADGRGIYLRLPPGKVGEEFLGWFTKPGTMLENKSSPLVRPIIEAIVGHDTLGRPITTPDPQTVGEYMSNAGAIVMHIAKSQLPMNAISGAAELFKHHVLGQPSQADPGVTALKVLGPLTGLAQVSSGFPGGPAAGEINAETQRQRAAISKAMPDIRAKIKAGNVDEAAQDMLDLGMSRSQIRWYIIQTQHPGPSRGAMQRFERLATPETRERLQRLQQQGASP